MPPESALGATAKTPHRRRRKVKATPNKENTPRAANSNNPSTKKVSGLDFGLNDDDVAFSKMTIKAQHGRAYKETLEHFQICTSQIPSLGNLYQENGGLDESVIQSSLNPKAATGLWNLQQHAPSLVGQSRKCIKLATTDEGPQSESLFVALHQIRAAMSTLDDITQIETCLKLLYHLISTASERFEKDMKDYAPIAFSGYEALQECLGRLECPIKETKRICFQKLSQADTGEFSIVRMPSVSSRSSPVKGGLKFRQINTIFLKSTLAISSILLKISLHSLHKGNLRSKTSTVSLGIFADTLIGRSTSEVLGAATLLGRQCYSGWLAFALDTHDDEVGQDILSHCKAGHRLFWENAAKLKAISQSAKTNLDDSSAESACLDLRSTAINIFMPKIRNRSSLALIKATHFESTCTYAWKAALVYLQHDSKIALPVSPNDPLSLYYNNVKPNIDSYQEASSDRISTSWLEFSFYQALHTGTGAFDKHCTGIEAETTIESSLYEVLLLTISSKYNFSSRDASTSGKESVNFSEAQDPMLQRVVRNFESMFSSWQDLHTDIRKKYFKLFSILSLPRFVFQSLKQNSFAGGEIHLLRLSLLMVKCIAPIVWDQLQQCQDGSKVDGLADLTTEFFIRPLVALERLDQASGEATVSKLRDTANRLVADMYEMVFDEGGNALMPTAALEKCAKTLASIARQRAEKYGPRASFVPTAYSLIFFRHLSKHSTSDFQISVRFAHFANDLESSGMKHHALVSIVYAIAHDICNCYRIQDCASSAPEMDTDDTRLLQFLASRSNNVIPATTTTGEPTPLTRSLIRKLVTLILDSGAEHGDLNENQPEFISAWRNLVGHDTYMTFFKEQNSATSTTIIPVLVQEVQLQLSRERLPSSSCGLQIMLMVDVLTDMGNSIQKLTDDEEKFLDVYGVIVEELQRLVGLLPANNSIAKSALLVVASSSLYAVQRNDIFLNKTEPNTASLLKASALDSATQYAYDAFDEIETPEGQPGEDNLSKTLMLVVVQSLCCSLESAQGLNKKADLFQFCGDAIGGIREAEPAHDNKVQVLLRDWVVWTIFMIQSEYQTEGDSVRCQIASFWILECLNDNQNSVSDWLRATVSGSYRSEPFCTAGINFLDEAESLSSHQGPLSIDWFVRVDYLFAMLRASVDGPTEGDLIKVNEYLQMLHSMLVSDQDTISADIDFMVHWTLSSFSLKEALDAEADSSFLLALEAAQLAGKHCQAVIKLTRTTYQKNVVRSLLEHVAWSTILFRSNHRYAEILRMRSEIYGRLGDHRKAAAYIASLGEFIGTDLGAVGRGEQPNLEAMFSSASTLAARQYRRIGASTYGVAMPIDLIIKSLNDARSNWPVSTFSTSDDVSEQLETIFDALAVGDLAYGESVNSSYRCRFPEIFHAGVSWYLDQFSSNRIVQYLQSFTEDDALHGSTKLAISKIRYLLEESSDEPADDRSEVKELCQFVVESPLGDRQEKAWAHYYFATVLVEELRLSGALRVLWEGDVDGLSEQDNSILQHARDNLLRAASICPCGTNLQSRMILRNMALLAGPEEGGNGDTSSAFLVMASIGGSSQQAMIRALSQTPQEERESEIGLADVFSFFAGNLGHILQDGTRIQSLFELLSRLMPPDWKFVAATLCPTGDMLSTSIGRDATGEVVARTTCALASDGESLYTKLLDPIDKIVQESQRQLSGMDVSAVSELYNKETAKRQWWDNRHTLNEEMQRLLHDTENQLFPNISRRMDSDDSIFEVECATSQMPIDNLASKFEAAVVLDEGEKNDDEISLQKLTVPLLKDRLKDEFGYRESDLRRVKKLNLIEMLLGHLRETLAKKPSSSEKDATNQVSGGCLILIMDENLHRFPFEGMPTLMEKTVCRLPSLPFALASLLEHGVTDAGRVEGIDTRQVSCVLDPESNLLATRKRLAPVLETLAEKPGSIWDTVVGEKPPLSFFEENLQRPSSLFLYFGHGGGQTCFSRRHVESLISDPSQNEVRKCKASAVLMGCSSGRLQSINRKHSQTLEEIPIHYEPEGIALSYLCAGAPCVVGCLWDVTDHDIDRFSLSLLENFVDKESANESLASCVAKARKACKLQYIVGCAPVCYGIPIYRKLP